MKSIRLIYLFWTRDILDDAAAPWLLWRWRRGSYAREFLTTVLVLSSQRREIQNICLTAIAVAAR